MTTTRPALSWRSREAKTTCRQALSWRSREGPDGPETNESGCLGPGLGPGPPWWPKGPPWGPMPTHTPWCPGFGPDEFRWPFRTTICMAKEMWFLRPLTEWPGFPTLLYSVIQCTAAVPLHGMCFSPEYYFGKTKYFYHFIIICPPPPNYFQVDGGQNLQNACVLAHPPRRRPPTTH